MYATWMNLFDPVGCVANPFCYITFKTDPFLSIVCPSTKYIVKFSRYRHPLFDTENPLNTPQIILNRNPKPIINNFANGFPPRLRAYHLSKYAIIVSMHILWWTMLVKMASRSLRRIYQLYCLFIVIGSYCNSLRCLPGGLDIKQNV